MIIRNSVILIVQIDMDLAKGLRPWDAVIDATTHRLRPIVLTAAAASLGMIPIASEVFWGPMAYAIIGGLFVATLFSAVSAGPLCRPVPHQGAAKGTRAASRSRGACGSAVRGGFADYGPPVTCCRLGRTASTIRAQNVVACSPGGDVDHPDRGLDQIQPRQCPELVGKPASLTARALLPRTSRIVRHLFPILAVKIAIRVAVGSRRIAGAFPRLHALRQRPGLDQPTVEREMLVRQQRGDPRVA